MLVLPGMKGTFRIFFSVVHLSEKFIWMEASVEKTIVAYWLSFLDLATMVCIAFNSCRKFLLPTDDDESRTKITLLACNRRTRYDAAVKTVFTKPNSIASKSLFLSRYLNIFNSMNTGFQFMHMHSSHLTC